MSVRCGFGYDLHRLAEGRKLIVGGIELQSGDRVGSAGGSGASAAGNRTGPVARGQRAHQVAADESRTTDHERAHERSSPIVDIGDAP